MQIGSISGGTDILSCFVLNNPLDEVISGEIQCRGLGMAVDVFDEEGNFDPILVESRNINAETVAEHYNLSEPQYLTKNEVDSFKRLIKKKDLNPQTKLAFVANFQKAWGGAAADVFLQMGEKDANEISALGALVNAGRNEAALSIIKGLEEFDAGLKITGETEQNIMQIFTTFITDDEGRNLLETMDPRDQMALYNLAKAHYKGLGVVDPVSA